jgi:16S rRNA (cytosine967-C5)-methyltransferase
VSGEKPREIAVEVLESRSAREFTESLLERSLADTRLASADRRLCQELVYGAVRWQGTLDWLIARKTANRTQKTTLQNLLRLGLYQIFWLDRIPNHAAVHVTVELAKRRGFGPQSGFVNALLRGYLREFDSTRSLLNDLRNSQPHLGYSHPEWLSDRWTGLWGRERALELLAWNNTPPPTYARVNTLKTEAAKLLLLWRDENVEYDFVRRDWFEENLVFHLKSHPPLEELSSFRQGCFYVQDPSTLLAVAELNPLPGEDILDFCAAPGGKLTHMAQRIRNQGHIVAQDLAPERLSSIAENCSRLGVTCVELAGPEGHGRKAEDVPAVPQSALRIVRFDKILVDAPCSNTGVMRRRVDLRWRLKLKEIERLTKTQIRLLRQAVSLLKPGGTLVYSTCSLEPEENRQVVDAFLQECPELKLTNERQLVPFLENVDGAYVTTMKRAI